MSDGTEAALRLMEETEAEMYAPPEPPIAPEDIPFASAEDPHTVTLGNTRIRVTHSRLLVHLPGRVGDYVTAGGIHIPEAARAEQEELEVAVVMAVGDGPYNGDTGEFRGSDFEPGQTLWVCTAGTNQRFLDKVPGFEKDFIVLLQEPLVRAIIWQEKAEGGAGEGQDEA